MAKIEQGILGGFSGTVGTVVGSTWRGKSIMRAKPRKSRKKATQGQIDQRKKFKLVANFLAPLNALTGQFFGQYQGVKSRTNLAMSYHLLEAIKEDKGQFKLDYSKVLITKGVLPAVLIKTAELKEGTLNLSWDAKTGASLEKDSDKLTLVIYSESQKLFFTLEDIVLRGAQTYSAKLPNGWTAKDNSVWIVVTNEGKKECSTSAYVGTF